MAVFKVGDLVWGKMKGFPPWPGLISVPPEELQKHATKTKSSFCIYFFGTKNFAWINTRNLKHYEKNKENLMKSAKSSGFIAAVKEIEEYRQGDMSVVVSPAAGPFDLIIGKNIAPKKSNIRNLKGNPVKSRMKNQTKQDVKDDEVSRSDRMGKKRSNTNAENEDRTKRRKSELNDAPTQEDSSSLDEQRRKERLTLSFLYPRTPSYLFSPSIRRPESSPTKDQSYPESQKKDVISSELRFGFIGLGIKGSGIVRNLLKTGHKVTVWNRTTEKGDILQQIGAEVCDRPGEVVMASDITFCCVSDIEAAQQIVFGNCGVLEKMGAGKSFVEISRFDSKTSTAISKAIISTGGRYLEVRLQGSRKEANEGSLVILAAGDKSLYDDCEICFSAFGNYSTFLGDVGFASNTNAIIRLITATALGGLAEGLSLVEKRGISISMFIEILKHSHLNCQFLTDKCKKLKQLNENNITPNNSVTHLRNDVVRALKLGNVTNTSLYLGEVAKYLYTHATRIGHRHNGCLPWY